MNAELVVQLQGMGFSYNRAVRALHATGTDNMEQAVNWIVEHTEDADVDMPLLLPKVTPPPPPYVCTHLEHESIGRLIASMIKSMWSGTWWALLYRP